MSKIIQIEFKNYHDIEGRERATLYGLDDNGIVWFLAENGVKEWLPLVDPVESPEIPEGEVVNE